MAQKLLPKEDLAVTYNNLRAKALHAHFLAVAEASPDMMFALSSEALAGETSVPLLRDVHARLTMAVANSVEGLANDLTFTSNLALPGHDVVVPATRPLNDPEAQDLVFFKVVHTNPSRRRTMTLSAAAAGQRGRLHAHDVAVSVHEKCPSLPHLESPCLSLTPETTSGGSSAQVLANLPKFMSFDAMCQGLLCSRPKSSSQGDNGQLMYSFASEVVIGKASFEHCSQIATSLVTKQAFPGAAVWVEFPFSTELQALLQLGLIINQGADHPEKYQLTGEGLDSMRMFKPFAPFVPVTSLTHGQLELPAPTVHELLQLLEAEGWSWDRLPQKRKREDTPQLLSYEIGRAPKVWRTSGLTVSSDYLQCLLKAQDLQTTYGIQHIPHGLSASCYAKLLEGQVPAAPPNRVSLALENDLAIAPDAGSVSQKTQKGSVKPQQLNSLTDGLAADAVSNSNAQEDAAAAQSVQSEDERSEGSLLNDFLEALGRDESQEAPVLPDAISLQQGPVGAVGLLAGPLPPSEMSEDGHGAANNSDAPGNLVSSAAARVEVAVDGDIAASNPAPARTARPAAAAAPAADERREAAAAMGAGLSWTSFKFGAFRFTSKKPKTTAQFSWQVTCPFHAKSNHTGCKKAMNVTPVTEEKYKEVILCLKHWCNQAKKFTRQRHHLAFNVSSNECPPESVIEASVIPANEAPDRPPNDEDLDAKASAKAKAKAKGKSNARAKSHAAPKFRGRGRGGGRSQADRDHGRAGSPGDEAASDPTSSSSSSSSSDSESDSGTVSS